MSTIKECFPTRYIGGHLLQFDYSQLEVICLAYLSGDDVLQRDLREGVDMHCRSASFMTGRDYKDIKMEYDVGNAWAIKARKEGKALGFLVQYGGSANLMHKNTGIPKERCRAFIQGYYKRYYRIKEWQQEIEREVRSARVPSTRMVGSMQAGMAVIKTLTGRRYTFIEQVAPKWVSSGLSFSPTQMKNFPIQGFATGDLVPMMLGRVNRFIKKQYDASHVKLINTTHDSVMLDVSGSVDQHKIVEDITKLLETAPAVLKEVFDIEFDMALKVDCEMGFTWGTMTPYVPF